MALRIGFLGVTHMHAWGYAWGLRGRGDAEAIGVHEPDRDHAGRFSSDFQVPAFETAEALLDACDAVIVCSENTRHAECVELAAAAGKHVLCEKPLAPNDEHGRRILAAVERSGIKLMTAFPCRFSPAFRRLKDKVGAGTVGTVRGICATNRGSCPFGWFVERDKSGGGAMIDHVVHVADLLRALLEEEPVRVQAQIGHNVYGQDWEDTAMVTIEFGSGVFATLDSSWSRPKSYKTWGDVTMNVVGDTGVLEMDMFGWSADVYRNETMRYGLSGFGSNMDAGLTAAFIEAVLEDKEPVPNAYDGIQAARVAIAGYESVRRGGEPVALA
ncbi:MAG: Gfo/Idh/MocA family oxidoreductase [Fimbriimonadaceae bacterium]|nr:Gfo/Idh/MocA family oxidoreductase [Fimbriimonadaceae bacterium]